MALTAGPLSSRYVPPPRAVTGPRDLATAIEALINDHIERGKQIRTAVQSVGCDGLPQINRLDGTGCAPVGGPMVLVHDGWLFEARVPRNLTGAGGSPAIVSETVLPTRCEQIAADFESRLRFADNKGNLWDADGKWLSTGHTPATSPQDPLWYYRGGEFMRQEIRYNDNSVIVDYWGTGIFPLAVGMSEALVRQACCLGANVDGTCMEAVNSDLVLTCEVTNWNGVRTAGSHSLVIRSAETLLPLGRLDMQYVASAHTYAVGGAPQFMVTATEDGSWWVHLFGGETISSPPSPLPNWEYCNAPPGVPNYIVARVTVDRGNMTPSIAEYRRVYPHADMTAWDDETFLTAYLEGA